MHNKKGSRTHIIRCIVRFQQQNAHPTTILIFKWAPNHLIEKVENMVGRGVD